MTYCKMIDLPAARVLGSITSTRCTWMVKYLSFIPLRETCNKVLP